MDIKSRHLQHLAAIGAHGSFVRAARSLNISQPALSLSVKRIEDITGAKLVDRGRSGAQLTEAGQLLARRGTEINSAVSSAAEEIELLSHGIAGQLHIGGTPLSVNSIIPEVINRILSVTQDVAISVIEGLDEDLLDMLSSNALDAVISAPGIPVNSAVFDEVPLFSARTVLVVRPGHPLSRAKSVSLADLADNIWALPARGGAFSRQIEALLTANGIPYPQRAVHAASIHVLTQIVSQSDAVTLASEQVVRDDLQRGDLTGIPLTESAAPRQFSLQTRHNRDLSDLGKLFCDLTVELAAKYDMRIGHQHV